MTDREYIRELEDRLDHYIQQPTLRDQFAMAYLTGLRANPNWQTGTLTLREDIEECYQYANEAMKAREVKP